MTRIIEGFELPKFKAHFEKWPRTSQSSVSEDGRGKVAGITLTVSVRPFLLSRCAPVSQNVFCMYRSVALPGLFLSEQTLTGVFGMGSSTVHTHISASSGRVYAGWI